MFIILMEDENYVRFVVNSFRRDCIGKDNLLGKKYVLVCGGGHPHKRQVFARQIQGAFSKRGLDFIVGVEDRVVFRTGRGNYFYRSTNERVDESAFLVFCSNGKR